MIYTELTKKALKISFEAHKEQLDKSDIPYVYHLYHLAQLMPDEYSVYVALLHDVIEDGDITIDYIIKAGFPSELVEAVKLMTHKKGMSYLNYIKNIKMNPLATKVKVADLKHNSNIARLNFVTAEDLERIKKYKHALEILEYDM